MRNKVINIQLLKSATTIKRRLPTNFVEEDSEFYVGELEYKTYDCWLKLVKNARISSDSIVYQKGSLVNETLYSDEGENYYRGRYLLKKFVTAKKINLDKATKYLLVTDYSSTGHFHWMTEALPRLFCIKDISEEFVLLLPDNPYIKKIATATLEALHIEFQDILFTQENEFYQANNLYFVSKLSLSGQLHGEIMQEINSLFTAHQEKNDKRIYISREKANFRKILNEKELIAMLKDYGFDTLYGEDLTLSEQIKTFSACQILLGIHGAGLTNCLFMQRQSYLIELRKNEINNGYWSLADALNHNYYYYNGVPDSDMTLIGRGCNLAIPLGDFEEKILNKIVS